MPRPARYSADSLLDVAAQLLAAEGPSAVTMSAVARATGAPSGSVYHRFPTRAALCGELWVRTEERFQDALVDALSVDQGTQQRCVAGALRIVQWCRENSADAQVLLAGPHELGMADWPDPIRARKRLQRKLRKAFGDLPDEDGRVTAAVIDVPGAIVRRHLRARQTIPVSVDAIVTDCARALIAPD
jgi:AcrR family transcriptional regulator